MPFNWKLSSKLIAVWLISLMTSIAAAAVMRRLGFEGPPVYGLGISSNALAWLFGYFALIRKLHR